MKHITERLNTQNAVIVITSFGQESRPTKQSETVNAIAWHSFRTLQKLSRSRRVIVCAEEVPGENKYTRINKNLIVARVWKKGSTRSLYRMLKFIARFHRVRSVYVQFEFNVFGGILPNISLLAVLSALKYSGRQIAFEFHQIIFDIRKLEKHIHIKNPLKQMVFNAGLKAYYFTTGRIADTVIVFEKRLKNLLSHYINPEKIVTSALSVQPKRGLPKQRTRARLGLKRKPFTILVFGYINGYKGIDWILTQASALRKQKVELVIAGGENPYLAQNPSYQEFYRSIQHEANQHKNVTLTGFVPEKDIPSYFSAADLVVLPYEVFMSGSGPFSHTLAYRKPVLISEALSPYTQSSDLRRALHTAGLSPSDITFKLSNKSFLYKVKKAQTDKKYLKTLAKFSHTLASLRNSKQVINRLDRALEPRVPYSPQKAHRFNLLLQS